MEHKVGGKTTKKVFENPITQQLADSACRGNIKNIKSLLASGANVNDSGFQGSTPLLWALSCENEKGMRTLLELGADPNQKAHKNYSAVTLAAGYNNPIFLKLLLEFGGDPDAKYYINSQKQTNTALEDAFSKGDLEDKWKNYYMLLDAGADINKISKEVDTTIAEIAILHARYCKVIELLDRGYNQRLVELLYSAEYSYKRHLIAPEFQEKIKCREMLRKILWERVTQEEYNAYLRELEKKRERLIRTNQPEKKN